MIYRRVTYICSNHRENIGILNKQLLAEKESVGMFSEFSQPVLTC